MALLNHKAGNIADFLYFPEVCLRLDINRYIADYCVSCNGNKSFAIVTSDPFGEIIDNIIIAQVVDLEEFFVMGFVFAKELS